MTLTLLPPWDRQGLGLALMGLEHVVQSVVCQTQRCGEVLGEVVLRDSCVRMEGRQKDLWRRIYGEKTGREEMRA